MLTQSAKVKPSDLIRPVQTKFSTPTIARSNLNSNNVKVTPRNLNSAKQIGSAVRTELNQQQQQTPSLSKPTISSRFRDVGKTPASARAPVTAKTPYNAGRNLNTPKTVAVTNRFAPDAKKISRTVDCAKSSVRRSIRILNNKDTNVSFGMNFYCIFC